MPCWRKPNTSSSDILYQKFLFLFLIFSQLQIAEAANSPLYNDKWRFSIGTELSYKQHRDEILHKLRNQGAGFGITGSMGRQTQSSLHVLELKLPVALLVDKYDLLGINIEYGVSGKGLWKLYPGIKAGYFGGMNVRYYYFPEWDDAHIYWLTDYSVGPVFRYEGLGIKGVSLAAQLSLISLVSRTPQRPLSKFDNIVTFNGFFSTPQQDLHWESIRSLQSVRIDLDYASPVSRPHVWTYRFEMMRNDKPLQFVSSTQSLGWRYVF
jgi:hypothetical protein